MILEKRPKLDKLLLPLSGRKILSRFLLYFLPTTLAFSAVFLLFNYRAFEHREALELSKQTQRVSLARQTLVRDLQLIASDLLLLANSSEILSYLASPVGPHREALAQRFQDLARDRKIYDQVRLLDANGQELIRANFDGAVTLVPQQELQKKTNRYYFQQAIQTVPGTLFVSPLDLNMERGQVETPAKPVLRAVLHLRDLEGQSKGLLILNYLAGPMLERMRSVLPKEGRALLGLINLSGCWLDHPDPEKTFGFMFDRPGCFSQEHPDAWLWINETAAGQFEGRRGHYTFTRIVPSEEMTVHFGTTQKAEKDPSRWHVVGFLPRHSLSAKLLGEKNDWTVTALFVTLLFLTAGAFLQLARNRCRRDQWESLSGLLYHAIDQSPAAIIITDTQGGIEYTNEKFSALSGYSPREVLGQNPRLLKSDEKTSDDYAHLWETITDGNTWTGEFHNKRADGSLYYAKASISPVTNAKGEILHFVGVQEDITDQRRLQKELVQMATTDPLTGLHNRRYLYDSARAELTRCQRYSHPLSVMLLDLDHFKQINDTYGHDVGDAVLRETAHLLSDSIRQTDILVRFGGEEFVILLPETRLDQAVLFGERLRGQIEELVVDPLPRERRVTVSIGCSGWHPRETSIEETLRRADEAMYRAKNGGRNQVCHKAAPPLSTEESAD